MIFPDFQILDVAGPLAAFEIAALAQPSLYRLSVVAVRTGLVRSSSGVAMPAQALACLRDADTLIVAGGQGARSAIADNGLLGALKRLHPRVRRMASVCSGAFLLAGAGLLDGKRATTHWRHASLLARLFPKLRVEPDRIHIREGKIWTSAGVTAGIDLALAMIGEDLGDDVATAVAREMVVYAKRPGGQAQHSALLDLDAENDRFAKLNAWMREHLHEDLSVERLAREVAMSERNFARLYVSGNRRHAGEGGRAAARRGRTCGARAAADKSKTIARKTGFGDGERMRRAFMRLYGAPPAALRRTLRHA